MCLGTKRLRNRTDISFDYDNSTSQSDKQESKQQVRHRPMRFEEDKRQQGWANEEHGP